ncbi:CDP-diacylglycerol--serine O-phosphatidyltransferase [Psychrosphaera haliotis]|uniref:CDP-diacylglycerol--serine O-phosphatidyltransferase n=1 Tax=Psychrosphaera haliotis TaxID=555083 RepID=UPI0031E0399D
MIDFGLMDLNNSIDMDSKDLDILYSAKEYKSRLLELITNATSRIYITALYLQDDDAGREIMDALYKAKQNHPDLDIKIFVDAHRARRGLIGAKEQEGNRAFYLQKAKEFGVEIEVYGVAVKNKELFGVLHLKGMVFDNILFFTGASINDIYLHQQQKYRLDRYYQFNNSGLADSFVKYLNQVFVHSELAPRLNKGEFPTLPELKKLILQLKHYLSNVEYKVPDESPSAAELKVEPLVGFGKRRNSLNNKIRKLIQKSERSVVIFTPYFNLPKVLTRDVAKALKRGVKIEITVGDKTANDFFIHDDEKFSTIGIVPYVYEILLVRFAKRWKKYIDSGQLVIRLWKHEQNSYHLKGIIVDSRYHLVTGSNINPRAWTLDLENGLLIDDATKSLMPKVQPEIDAIYKHTTIVESYKQLDGIKDYPAKPQKLLNRIRMTQIDRILKRLL